jgi:hypothetical protein
MDRYINKVLFYALHVKFEQVLGFYQVLENNLGFCLQKKKSRTHKQSINKYFWLKIFTTNTLGTNVHKMYECDINQALLQCKMFHKVRFLGIFGH